jgi:hypothetical protein
MAREQGTILDSGDPFPRFEIDTTAGDRLTLPDHFTGGWGILLAYRGHW